MLCTGYMVGRQGVVDPKKRLLVYHSNAKPPADLEGEDATTPEFYAGNVTGEGAVEKTGAHDLTIDTGGALLAPVVLTIPLQLRPGPTCTVWKKKMNRALILLRILNQE